MPKDTNSARPGALPGDWSHFERLGLGKDLLPVVSDLTAKISEKSKLKVLGKTPSRFLPNGEVVGIPEWTQKEATDAEIARWSRDPRIGILVQTRWLRLLDLDIEDPVKCQRVVDMVEAVAGVMPRRVRSNSGKCALAFFMRGEFTKRVIHTEGGAIEFLATGQQFAAVGTHPSGVRYEWPGGLPKLVDIPELSQADFMALWGSLMTLAIEPERVARGGIMRPAVKREASAMQDSTVEFLEGNDWIRSWTKDGVANLVCPWEQDHTTGTDETATQYFPAGVGGFALGHFKCLHAHCVGRQDWEFVEAVGLMKGEFDDLTAAAVGAVAMLDGKVPPERAKPGFARNKDNSIKASVPNLIMALERPDCCNMKIGWDDFKDELMCGSADESKLDWRHFKDSDYVRLRRYLQDNGFAAVGRELVRDVVHFVAMEHRFDSAQLWIRSLAWDGVPRVERFFSTYFGAADTPYTRAVALYLWSALAGRAVCPGVKADMIPILKSEQGTIKTESVIAMAPHEDFFAELDLSKTDDTLARATRGKLVCEISELRGLNSRDQESIKAWASRRFEEWIPKYKEFGTKFARRFIAIGTTNEDEILADATGERRWLPLIVGLAWLAGIKRDCEQLWAEGLALYQDGGVRWERAEQLAKAEHYKFKVHDSWIDVVGQWLDEPAFGQPEGVRQGDRVLKMNDVLTSALGLNPQNITRKDELRVAKVFRLFGYVVKVVRFGKGLSRAWVNQDRIDAARAVTDLEKELG